ncbi:Far8 protein [Maudiozyma humilis]|uniref:Far8 protein n=1 Tax=Maudiozyma humilis TaxID=51915 RepID=A0AAV5S4K0_MAUHU|nr:Far8 protein [Kazachstania humilis]
MSAHTHQQYSLPGVMHYLQTEFSKNERDRITWELERAEMKSYIASLEGENKELRRKLAQLGSAETAADAGSTSAQVASGKVDSESLMKAKASVEDSVKDIIHLLNSPSVLSQFDSLNGRKAPVHEMERLALNKETGENNGNGINARSVVTESLFADNSAVTAKKGASNNTGSVGHISQISTSENQFISVFKNNILVTLDEKLKIFKIDEELQCNETGVVFDSLDIANIRGLFWLGSEFILALDDSGVKVWSLIQQRVINELNIFDEKFGITPALSFDDIIKVDFKNKWLLLQSGDNVHILEFSDMKEPHMMTLANSYTVSSSRVMDVLLGITEMSLIVLTASPLSLVIYDFEGEVLQRVALDKEVSEKLVGKQADAHLHLNKESSKLIVQLGKHMVIYSFDQKRVVLQHTLNSVPQSMYFKYATDTVGLAYDDGTVELRELPEFSHVIKKYIHNPESKSAGRKDVLIEATRISNFETILLSLSENVLKLEAFEEKR